MNKLKLITLFLILLIVPITTASIYSEMREKAVEITENQTINYQIYQIDLFLWNLNNGSYEFHKERNIDLTEFWKTGKGDCTELARVKQIMYKAIGLNSRIVHGYVEEYKHDYVVYYNSTAWTSTEYRYSNYTLRKIGRGIW